MNCMIVDDEELAHNVIEEYISRTPFLKLKKNCYHAFEAMEELQKSKIDIIFLDINLPEITGIEFLKSTPNLPMIIFTTAYNNYAIEGFNLNAVDYLLKPFSFERFLQAANKCFHINKMNQKQTIDFATNHSEFIFVRCNNEDIKINLDTIVRINGLKDYVIIHTLDNKYIVHSTLKAILEKINSSDFIRIHNSHIVSLKHLQSIGKNSVTIDNTKLPLSSRFKEPLMNFVRNHF